MTPRLDSSQIPRKSVERGGTFNIGDVTLDILRKFLKTSRTKFYRSLNDEFPGYELQKLIDHWSSYLSELVSAEVDAMMGEV